MVFGSVKEAFELGGTVILDQPISFPLFDVIEKELGVFINEFRLKLKHLVKLDAANFVP